MAIFEDITSKKYCRKHWLAAVEQELERERKQREQRKQRELETRHASSSRCKSQSCKVHHRDEHVECKECYLESRSHSRNSLNKDFYNWSSVDDDAPCATKCLKEKLQSEAHNHCKKKDKLLKSISAKNSSVGLPSGVPSLRLFTDRDPSMGLPSLGLSRKSSSLKSTSDGRSPLGVPSLRLSRRSTSQQGSSDERSSARLDPSIGLPAVRLSSKKLPSMGVPSLGLSSKSSSRKDSLDGRCSVEHDPSIGLPSLRLSSKKQPSMGLPSLGLSSTSSSDGRSSRVEPSMGLPSLGLTPRKEPSSELPSLRLSSRNEQQESSRGVSLRDLPSMGRSLNKSSGDPPTPPVWDLSSVSDSGEKITARPSTISYEDLITVKMMIPLHRRVRHLMKTNLENKLKLIEELEELPTKINAIYQRLEQEKHN